MKKSSLMIVVVCITCLMVSCKKNYQKITTEFIRNLPDSCTLLVQVENETDHLIYYKGLTRGRFYRYNAETGINETVVIPPNEEYGDDAIAIGAGKENIMVGNLILMNDIPATRAYVQIYNLKTQKFRDFAICSMYDYNEGGKQLSCFYDKTDRNGDGSRTIETYDFDGNLLSQKESELYRYEEVPVGTLAAKRQADIIRNEVRYYCRYCGKDYPSISAMMSFGGYCMKSPTEKHVPY